MDSIFEKDEVSLTPLEPPIYTPPVTQYYADFNKKGNIIGFYVNDIHGDNIPETAISISLNEWKLYSANANAYKFDGERIREKNQEEIDEEYVKPEPISKTPEQVSIDQIGSQLVQRELESLEIKEQNQAMGSHIVGLELRVLTLEIKPEGDGENV
ncbi:hypothetical protein ACP8HI_16485 [Paenibacillus sp. FA6]|uniref:hypothetical protein n=1 Tax=Paenibacillus sp. FA6 TaxID=3413029 RepID=UPI003F65E3A1